MRIVKDKYQQEKLHLLLLVTISQQFSPSKLGIFKIVDILVHAGLQQMNMLSIYTS
jgi:hypothetical protein